MSKIEGKVARSIVTMLILRKRSADKNLKWVMGNLEFLGEDYSAILTERIVMLTEAHNAAEVARRMLYNS